MKMKKIYKIFGVMTVILFLVAGLVLAVGPRKSNNPKKRVLNCLGGGGFEATFVSTGDGGWQEWQNRDDGTQKHLIFKPTTKPKPEEDCWWGPWTSHYYDCTPSLRTVMPFGSTWWVCINEVD